jgi:predicted transcriptional regulator of viral defense system
MIFLLKIYAIFIMIEILRKKISGEEFDYQTLMDCLAGYSSPRDKVTQLLKKGIIIRVKKGLYVFGEAYRRRPYSRELLANLIYGPSYISLEYALQFYGLIPERVEAVTSVTTGRSRRFSISVGLFTYRCISLEAFGTGMDRIELNNGPAFLIATAEKALADKCISNRGIAINTQRKMINYLENNLRVDMTQLLKLKVEALEDIARRYRSRKITLLSELIKKKS